MELNEILQIALRGGASDIHLKAGLPPMFRVDGSLVPLKDGKRLPPEEVARMAFGIMNEFQKEKFKQSNEVDLAYGVPGLGRFRVNVFQQRGTIGAVMRVIPTKVMAIKELMLPPILEKICLDERGLILVTGTTGSGKSTTLAAMIDHINATETNHIMTIEDPIEFLIRDKRSIVNQREVGVDTMSFAQALKSALRQDPDVILVGEMRDHETIETALAAAETGHLVMSTLHTLDATETINRIVSAFPPYQQKQVRIQLASVLKAVVSQRLIPRADGKGRVAAVEVLRCTARVKELIEDKDRTKEIPDAISQGFDTYGMQTFDQSLMSLVKQGLVTYEEAHRQATNPDDFALRFSGISATSDSKWDNFDGSGSKPVPGSANFGQQNQQPAPAATPARAAPAPAAARPGAPSSVPRPGVPAAAAPTSRVGVPAVGGARPAAPAPAPAPAPAAPKAPAPDDDFQIERF
ncbi:MAG TPA: type IV pilus twitching motility protein PilT [Archangium sp.]